MGIFSGWGGADGAPVGAAKGGQQLEVVLKTGHLWKRGGHKGGRKTWKRRFFALKDETLHYYSPSNPTLLGAMPLVGLGDGAPGSESFLATTSII